MNRAAIATLVALAAPLGACECRKETPAAPPPASGSGSAAPRVAPTPPKLPAGSAAQDEPAPPGVTARMVTMTREDATAALPAIEGVTVLGETRVAPEGQQALAGWCIAASDQAAAHDYLRAELVAGGWDVVGDRAAATRRVLVATKAPYRLQASISPSPHPGCNPADDDWFASVALFKLAPVDN